MAHTYTSLFVHIIYSTRHREPFLTLPIRDRLFPYMGGIVRELGGTSLLINGVEDHVHMLVKVPSTSPVADFLRVVKANSSGWVKEAFPEAAAFGWQTGYAAFNVSKSGVAEVRNYIARQEEHHGRVTIREEYLEFLRRHEIECDERFVME